jgi:hypothetical protein
MARPAQLSVPFREQPSTEGPAPSVPKGLFSEPGRAPLARAEAASNGPVAATVPSRGPRLRVRERTATSITQPMPRVVAAGGPPLRIPTEGSAEDTATSGVRPVARSPIQGRSPWAMVVDEEVVLSPDDPRRER